ncbi:hypothetical protein L6164_026667 [Bauhinia variegata]|uniref:Uncharacterized protein n=1 Tax=Bauhinia variegata TaxID=167791 RepID=A0ACB9LQT0_BAUVA|nr:hypothetical protein L6164_026667 [Bauhinia variegata]
MHQMFSRSSSGWFNGILKNHFNVLKIPSHVSLFYSALSKSHAPASKLDFILNEVEELQSSKLTNTFSPPTSDSDEFSDMDVPNKPEHSAVKISHPWPEWVDLMECLLKRGYFDAEGNPFQNDQLGAKESKIIRTACLNFGRDQYNLLGFLSRKDIQVAVQFGCPSLDRKVINSGKRLRAYVGINEGNVCSSCNLRGDCDRAFVKAREDEGGRTVDVMRIILTYGLDPIIDSVENKPCLSKMVKESVRRLLKELVKASIEVDNYNNPDAQKVEIRQANTNPEDESKIKIPMKQGDWLCPKCNFHNFARNIKCLRCNELFQERIKQLQQDQDHLPLKKGDWICNKCNFLNFAKNTRCFQCQENPPKRQLNPGEWECPSCNYINFRRNMVCLKCDHRRPKASNVSDSSFQSQHEDKDHHENCKLNLLRSNGNSNYQSSMVMYRNRSRGSNTWRFVDNVNDDQNRSNSWNDNSQFINFPIVGGMTEFSENAQKREEWKKDMLRRSKGLVGTSESDDEFWSDDNENRKRIFDLTDDEEIDEWFGNGKNGRNKIPESK